MSRVGRWVRRRLPEPLKRTLRVGAEWIDDAAGFVDERRAGERQPVPPRRIRASVGQPSRRRYRASGRLVAGELTSVLDRLDRPLAGFDAICDLASGPGKVLCELEVPAGRRLAAIDVNADAIAWLQAHLPAVDARVDRPRPPTSFPDASFDLLFSISLFTHLSEPQQDRWLAEVARLLAPGGSGILTVHGPTAYEEFRSGARPGVSAHQLTLLRSAGRLAELGFVFAPEPHADRRTPGSGAEWGLAFHDEGYIRERWSQHLAVETVFPAALNFGQDAVIVRPR